jgi:hypothetical protein
MKEDRHRRSSSQFPQGVDVYVFSCVIPKYHILAPFRNESPRPKISGRIACSHFCYIYGMAWIRKELGAPRVYQRLPAIDSRFKWFYIRRNITHQCEQQLYLYVLSVSFNNEFLSGAFATRESCPDLESISKLHVANIEYW